MEKSTAAKARSLPCPMCEACELRPFGRECARCEACRYVLGGAILDALRQIAVLPEALGSHACESGHPKMRRLPDGVYRCPACG